MSRVLILADDLTGAADCAAAFLGRARDVAVLLDSRARTRAAVRALDLDTRSRPERSARRIVRQAFSGRAAREARVLFKKIDSTLRGHIAAELAAIRPSLRSRPVLFAPAFPAQGRTVRNAKLYVNGKLSSGDLHALLSTAGLPAACVFVCDAASDADLDRIARAGLALRPRPLFVGSAGLARALARTMSRRKSPRAKAIERRPVVTVVGSASAISHPQVVRLSVSRVREKGDTIFEIEWDREPTRSDIPRVRNLGRMAARTPPAHYVLTGGETARALLAARKIRSYRLLGEVEPGVPFGMASDGTLICTKAGAFGRVDTLVKCVARLKREMKKP